MLRKHVRSLIMIATPTLKYLHTFANANPIKPSLMSRTSMTSLSPADDYSSSRRRNQRRRLSEIPAATDVTIIV
jgi:hypothetical protein